jgi:hypothetical protein
MGNSGVLFMASAGQVALVGEGGQVRQRHSTALKRKNSGGHTRGWSQADTQLQDTGGRCVGSGERASVWISAP